MNTPVSPKAVYEIGSTAVDPGGSTELPTAEKWPVLTDLIGHTEWRVYPRVVIEPQSQHTND